MGKSKEVDSHDLSIVALTPILQSKENGCMTVETPVATELMAISKSPIATPPLLSLAEGGPPPQPHPHPLFSFPLPTGSLTAFKAHRLATGLPQKAWQASCLIPRDVLTGA